MKINRYVLPLAVLNLITIVLATLGLPDIVPLHINFTGSVNLFGSKWVIPFIGLIPILLVTIYNFKSAQYGKSLENKNIKNKLIPILALFFMVIPWFLVIIGLGDSTSLNRLVTIFISVLLAFIFIIIAYFIPSIEPNRIAGIRTPWTLKNEVVWRKTNKLASYLFLISGLFVIFSSIATFISNNMYYVLISWLITILLVAIVPTFYSYYKYNKINN